MKNFGLDISQEKIDVTHALPTQKVFSTSFKTMPIFMEDKQDKSGNSGDLLTFTIKHGLGFVPFPLCYYKVSSLSTKWKWIPTSGISLFSDSTNAILRIDKENLVILLTLGNGVAETATIHYTIFNFPIALSI